MVEPPEIPQNAWYYLKDGKKLGPFSDEQLKQLASAAMLLPTDPVWRDGLANWVAGRELPELRHLFYAHEPREFSANPHEPPPLPSGGDMNSPVTNAALPTMANLICVYCLVVNPILWLMGNFACCMTASTSYSREGVWGSLEIGKDIAATFLSFGIILFLAWSAKKLRQLDIAYRKSLMWGFGVSVGYSIAHSLFDILFAIVADAAGAASQNEPAPAELILFFMMALLSLSAFAFEIIAFIWLFQRRNTWQPMRKS